jgi:hypothetical protein
VSLGVIVITAILARFDYQLIKIQWFAKQIPGGLNVSTRLPGAISRECLADTQYNPQ